MKADIWKFEVHPAADEFPMLSAEDLNELADDIKANGLVHPLVVKDGVLIDGRNRREACKIAGVTPEVVELNGADPVAYILSSNVNRRHMTTGQRAMVVAKVTRNLSVRDAAEVSSLNRERVRQARVVLDFAQEEGDQVKAGVKSLDKAYEIALGRKLAAEAPIKRLDALRARDPDLADKVVEEALSIDDAESAAKGRRDRERAARQGTYDALSALERYLFMFRDESHRAELVGIVRDHPNEISRETVLGSLADWQSAINSTIEALNEG